MRWERWRRRGGNGEPGSRSGVRGPDLGLGVRDPEEGVSESGAVPGVRSLSVGGGPWGAATP